MFAAIRLPEFLLQSALRHEPELWLRPVALIDEHEPKTGVLEMTTPAHEAGVRPGLTSTQALARSNGLIIKPRSRTQERAVQDILLQVVYGFSPRVESTAGGVATLDLQGLAAFREPDPARASAWGTKLAAALAQAGLRAHIGIAATPDLALHAAHNAVPLHFVEDSATFLAALPLTSLNPSPETLDRLHRWGIRRIGEFTALGKDNIAERLGSEGLDLFDQASADTLRPLELLTPSEFFSELMEFELEVESLPPLLFVLNRFVEQLTRRIELGHRVVAELHLRLKLTTGDHVDSTLRVPSPTARHQVLFRMLQTHLENVHTAAPIVAVELAATPCRASTHQFGLFETALRDPNQFSETLARLSALCGADNVGTPVLKETHRPDAFQMAPPDFERAPEKSKDGLTAALAPECGLKLRRFRPVVAAEVQLSGDAPADIHAPGFNGLIEKSSGPWRTSGEWWEPERLWNRDEWDIQVRGGALCRIYCEQGCWFVEGVYD